MPNTTSTKPAPIFNEIGELTRWRKTLAKQGKPCALVCGSFRLYHPGNLRCIKAASATGELCLMIEPGKETAASTGLLALVRGVTALAVLKQNEIRAGLQTLRPYILTDCLEQTAETNLQKTARAAAEKVNGITPLAGSFTQAIINAVKSGRTPLNLAAPEIRSISGNTSVAAFLSGRKGKKIVTVNGCFDLLHAGHAELFSRARAKGDTLIALVNDDASVRTFKGFGRPVFPIQHRLALVKALKPVTAAFAFSGDNPLALLKKIKPAVHVKGGSFIEERTRAERILIESWGGRLEFIPMVGDYSTSKIIAGLRKTR